MQEEFSIQDERNKSATATNTILRKKKSPLLDECVEWSPALLPASILLYPSSPFSKEPELPP
ncbi:Hypothetical protein FKW44_008453 [Caligus rogercresseyi]|uniref:Uncharacterized protein n=1 Tax=Caligus rogercresseyi TaxID=217165 RepID=A0A7T8QUA0_CALRO|nr:Hypothetical protein FKW44_008453 [Caligus rogercresseyi]